MSSSKQLLPGLLLAGFVVGCTPPPVEPELVLSASPRTIDGKAQISTVRVTTLDDQAKPGAGTVRISSTAGTLKDGVEIPLEGGEATTEFGCTFATDPGCTGVVRLTAEWVTKGTLVSISTSITVTPQVVTVPDAGMSLTSSRNQLGLTLGQSATITGTYSVDGVPTGGSAVALTTSLGRLLSLDGGPFVSPATTDSAGQLQAVLVDDGAAGTATVTATPPTGRGASVNVTIFSPDAGISITALPALLTVGFNQSSQITVNHTIDGRAVPGRMIQLQSSTGLLLELDGGPFTSPAPTDLSGRLQAVLTEQGSPGVAVVTATDPTFGVSAATNVTFAQPDAGVSVTTGRDRLYLGLNETVSVTARLVANGNPAAGRTLGVTSSLGTTLSLPDGGVFSGTGITDAAGALTLALKETGTEGTAVITATDPQSGRTGTANVNVLRITTIAHTGTSCGGTPMCTVMGISSSGTNTQAALTFVVRDAANNPAVNVPVTFTISPTKPSGTDLVLMSDRTNAMGTVDARVTSGITPGSFTVTASILGLSNTSPTVGVRGVRPTNKGFEFQCGRSNFAVYRDALPPAVISTTCTVTLVDRGGNAVGKSATVEFKSEAGLLPTFKATDAYPLATEGRASLPFDTSTGFPVDVQALTAQAGQYPNPLTAEPQRAEGSLFRNPRDGLVTLIAYTDGEEWFDDSNQNGIRDGVEQFVDQGEPFVDSNDNDVRDGIEWYHDTDLNGAWTPPNGVWDASAKVWAKTYVLYTNAAEPLTAVAVPSTFNVAKGTSTTIDVFMRDFNLNIVEAGSTATFSRTGTKGTISFQPNLPLDGFGFSLIPQRLTNAAGTADCGPTEQICAYHTVFGTWAAGLVGRLTINGAALIDMNPSEAVNVTIGVTTRTLQVNTIVSGTIQ